MVIFWSAALIVVLRLPAGVPEALIRAEQSAGQPDIGRLFSPMVFGQPPMSSDWLMYRFDPTHTGVNPYETAINRSTTPQLVKLWNSALTPNATDRQQGVFSTPAVSRGLVYVGSLDGWFHALRLDDGKEVWKRFLSLRTTNPNGENGTIASAAVVGDAEGILMFYGLPWSGTQLKAGSRR